MRDSVRIAEDETWSCTHENAPATLLRVPPLERFAMVDPHRWRRVVCPDCGSLWRAWQLEKIAKVSIEWPLAPARTRRAPRCDLDAIIERVLVDVPDLSVIPLEQPHAADDDALWWFRNGEREVALEQTGVGEFGECPFFIEVGDVLTTPDAVVEALLRLLRPPR